MAVGLLTTEQLMDTDPSAALVTWVAYLHRLAGRIRRQQKLRVQHWDQLRQERQRVGRSLPITPDVSRGMGARLDAQERTKKREQLLEMALGVAVPAGHCANREHSPTLALFEIRDQLWGTATWPRRNVECWRNQAL